MSGAKKKKKTRTKAAKTFSATGVGVGVVWAAVARFKHRRRRVIMRSMVESGVPFCFRVRLTSPGRWKGAFPRASADQTKKHFLGCKIRDLCIIVILPRVQ